VRDFMCTTGEKCSWFWRRDRLQWQWHCMRDCYRIMHGLWKVHLNTIQCSVTTDGHRSMRNELMMTSR